MDATEVVEEIEIGYKPPRVSEEREGIEDAKTQFSFYKLLSSTAWTGDIKKLSILIEDCWVCFFIFHRRLYFNSKIILKLSNGFSSKKEVYYPCKF